MGMNERNPHLSPSGIRDAIRKAALAVVLTALLAGLLWGERSAAAGRDDETFVRCDPATAIGATGQLLTVDIYVENVFELYAADVRLSFDPTMVQVYDNDPDASGIQILMLDDFLSPDFVLRKNADNVAGTIWYAATQMTPSEPVSGSGPLARITLQPLQAGSFTMPITYQKIVHSDSEQIEATAVDCQIIFVETETTPPVFIPVVMGES
jgi:hypothetical protein